MTSKKRRIFYLYALLLAHVSSIGLLSCGKLSRDPNQLTADHEELIISESATNITSNVRAGQSCIGYKMIEAFPANQLVAELNRKLLSGGWSQRSHWYLNPDTYTSHVVGWLDYITYEGDAEIRKIEWYGEWEKGDELVFYQLRYPSNLGIRDSTEGLRELLVEGCTLSL